MKLTPTRLMAPLLVPVVSAHAGLVAHFRFDGDLKDPAGRHDGKPVDPKLAPSFSPGRMGSAVVMEKGNEGSALANPSTIDFSRDLALAPCVNVENSLYFADWGGQKK
jgi:hypothetical protein